MLHSDNAVPLGTADYKTPLAFSDATQMYVADVGCFYSHGLKTGLVWVTRVRDRVATANGCPDGMQLMTKKQKKKKRKTTRWEFGSMARPPLAKYLPIRYSEDGSRR